MTQQTEQALREPEPTLTDVELSVSGMTCGSCAARVQRALSKREGVGQAEVNFATGTPRVRFDPERVSVGDLVSAVGTMGYGLAAVEPAAATSEDATGT